MSRSYGAWDVARKRSNREHHCERIDRAMTGRTAEIQDWELYEIFRTRRFFVT